MTRGGARKGAGNKRKTHRAARQRVTLSLDEIVCKRLAEQAAIEGVSVSELANKIFINHLVGQYDYYAWVIGLDIWGPKSDPFGFSDLADPAAIKKRYRELSKTYHPDMGGNSEQFNSLTSAYESALSRVSYAS